MIFILVYVTSRSCWFLCAMCYRSLSFLSKMGVNQHVYTCEDPILYHTEFIHLSSISALSCRIQNLSCLMRDIGLLADGYTQKQPVFLYVYLFGRLKETIHRTYQTLKLEDEMRCLDL